jgi:DNA repair exonuclease SbcCD ATPase subunit
MRRLQTTLTMGVVLTGMAAWCWAPALGGRPAPEPQPGAETPAGPRGMSGPPMGFGGRGEMEDAVGVPPTLDEGAAAKIDELYRRLDDLSAAATRTDAGASSEGERGRARGPGGRGGGRMMPGDPQAAQTAEIENQIISLVVGAALAAQHQEYLRKYDDLTRQQTELFQDRSLDNAERMTRLRSLGEQMAALNAAYPEVVQRRAYARLQVRQHAQRRGPLTQIKLLLRLSDEEWQAVAPRLEAVLRLQSDVRAAKAASGPGGALLPSRKWQNPPPNKEGELVKVLKTEDPDPKRVKDQLDALRKARTEEAARIDARLQDLTKQLKAAQERLRELLTASQEATLVIEGVLD